MVRRAILTVRSFRLPTQDSGKGEIWHGQLLGVVQPDRVRQGRCPGCIGAFHRDSGRLFRPVGATTLASASSLVQELVEIRRSTAEAFPLLSTDALGSGPSTPSCWQCQATVNEQAAHSARPHRTLSTTAAPGPHTALRPLLIILPLLAVQLLICVCGFPHLTDQATGRDFVLVNRRQLL